MWNLSEQEICLFSFIYISIYSIIHVLHCGLMDIYSKLRVITQYYLLRILLLLRCSNCFSLGFCVSLTYPQHCGFFLVWAFFENLLTFWPYKILQVHIVCSLQDPESAVLPRNTVSFYYRLVLENKIGALSVLTATKLSLLPGLLS